MEQQKWLLIFIIVYNITIILSIAEEVGGWWLEVGVGGISGLEFTQLLVIFVPFLMFLEMCLHILTPLILFHQYWGFRIYLSFRHPPASPSWCRSRCCTAVSPDWQELGCCDWRLSSADWLGPGVLTGACRVPPGGKEMGETRTRLCQPQPLGDDQSVWPVVLKDPLDLEQETRWEEPWEPEWGQINRHVLGVWLNVSIRRLIWKYVVYQGGRGEVSSTKTKVSGWGPLVKQGHLAGLWEQHNHQIITSWFRRNHHIQRSGLSLTRFRFIVQTSKQPSGTFYTQVQSLRGE